MSANFKATPRGRLQGVKDESGGDLPLVPVQVPTHLPHVFTFAEKGPTTPQIVVGSTAEKTFGSKTFDLRGKYATHATPFLDVFNAEGNAYVLHRLKPEDANPEATLALALETVEGDVTEYERNADGSVSLDQNGEPIPTGNTIPGVKARWVVSGVADGDVGKAQKTAGDLTNATGDQSTIYPIFELKASSFGSHGNLKGIRLSAPTLKSATPANDEAIEDQSAFIYRAQFIERPSEKSQPNVVETLGGSQDIEFTFKPGSVDRRVDRDLYVEDVLLQAYQNLDGDPPQWGPFGGLHVYEDYLDEVLTLLYGYEQPHQDMWPAEVEEAKHLFNFIGGQDLDGNKYHSYELLGASDGGAVLSSNTNHYARGGSDGTMTFEAFDALVKNECENYGDLENKFLDTARWPQSVIWDSGFTLETKKSLLIPMSRRKDLGVILCTQDVSQPQNTAEEESAIASSLRSAARVFPESEVYGTPVCRAAVVGHSGNLVNSRYRGLVPASIQLASRVANYMGASNGTWERGEGFDRHPYNTVNMLKNLNCTYKSDSAYDRDWDTGLIWIQNFDHRSHFFPALQTVYDDSTSVLNSLINMFVVIEAEKVAERTWRELTGNVQLTREEFIDRSNDLIAEKMNEDRFDNRVIVEPNTYFTDYDEELGYSWSCDITLYLNNMRTVGTYTIVSRRRDDFAG